MQEKIPIKYLDKVQLSFEFISIHFHLLTFVKVSPAWMSVWSDFQIFLNQSKITTSSGNYTGFMNDLRL